MPRKILPLFCILAVLLPAAPCFAADYAAGPVWDDLVQRSGDGYRLSAPAGWRPVDAKSHGLAEYFEASGRILPAVQGGAPVIVTAFLRSFPAASLEDAKRDVIEGYAQNSDRVFPDGFSHEEADFVLNGTQPAYLVNTRFYRKSKGLHQSRFDLVAFSDQSQRAFLYTLSVQYHDRSYALENLLQLKAIAGKLFSYFELG